VIAIDQKVSHRRGIKECFISCEKGFGLLPGNVQFLVLGVQFLLVGAMIFEDFVACLSG